MKDNVKLGTLGDIFIGLTYRPEDVANEGTIVLRSSNIQNGRLDFDDIVRVKCKVRENLIVKPNDILMCSRNGSAKLVGKCTLLPEMDEEMSFGAFMTIIRTQHNPYLLHFFNSNAFRCQLGSASTTTINQITRKMLDDISVPLYPKEQEDYIVSVFNQIDELIWTETKKLTLLDELVKSRFVELFGDTILNPYNWDKEPLGKVCDVRDGTHDSPKYYDTGYPLVTSKNLSSGDIDFSDCSLICKNDFDKINERSKVDFGDILMPMIGTVGNPVIVRIEDEFAIKNVALIKFCDNTNVTNVYIQALLKSDYFDSEVLGKVRGGTQKFISLGDIRKLEILVPPIELQNQFAAFVEQTDKSKLVIQKSLEKLETLKKALMQKYFG